MSDNGYDDAAIELLKELEPPRHRKPWDDLMYDPANPKEVAAVRRMMEDYLRENPGEDLSDAIAGLTVRNPSTGEK